MSEPSSSSSEERITELARQFWEEEGRPEGKAHEHWSRAEEQLRGSSMGSSDPETPAPASTPETSADSGEELS
ncbi:MAG TPA: DUF2934 domain-containing protein [Chthoniobacteraceae bacterium]|jgi:hypothetical protein